MRSSYVRTCSFCGDGVDVSAFGDGLVVTVQRECRVSERELYAHPQCLKRVLHAQVPFDAEMFED
jgi:hypothetical protein